MGSDDEVMEELLGAKYKVLYLERTDSLIIRKKISKRNVNFNIRLLKSEDIDPAKELLNSELCIFGNPKIGAFINDIIVGCIAIEAKESSDTLYFDIAVNSDNQGSGIGLTLISYFIKYDRTKGKKSIQASVINDDLVRILDNKFGFKSSGLAGEGEPMYLEF